MGKTIIEIEARRILAVWPCVSTETIRYYLQGVQVESCPGGVVAVATDGHVLAVIRDPGGVYKGPAGGLILCPDKAILAALKVGKSDGMAERRLVIVETDPNKYRFEVQLCLGEEGTTRTRELILANGGSKTSGIIDGKFPDWRKVIPLDKEVLGDRSITYQANKFSQFVKGLAAYEAVTTANCPAITFQFGAPSDPALLRCDSIPDFLGVIMPMRGDDKRLPIPDWLEVGLGAE